MEYFYQTLLAMATIICCGARPLNEDGFKPSFPSHVRKIQLYSRQGYFLTILKNGTIGGTTDIKSPDAILEMESFSIKLKRIRRPGSFYLTFLESGNITTTVRPNSHSLLIERLSGNYLTYENFLTKYILAMSTNFSPINGVRKRDLVDSSSQFMLLPNLR